MRNSSNKPIGNKQAGKNLLHNTRNRWASQANDRMFRTGTLWSCDVNKINGTERFRDLNENSLRNYHALRIALGKLSPQEQNFFNILSNAPFYVVHCSASPEVVNKEKNLILYSRKTLLEKSIGFDLENTMEEDIEIIGNDNYVFFSLEVGTVLMKPSSRFGKVFYKFPYSHPVCRNSSLVLVDQAAKYLPGCHIPELSNEARKILEGRHLRRLSIIFNGKMMSLLGLIYSIILTNRILPEADQEIVLSSRTDAQLSNVVNTFFRPEIRIPKMVGIKNTEYLIHILR